MKITKNGPNPPARKLVGVLNEQGTLFMRFKSEQAPSQRTATLNACYGDKTVVQTNGTAPIDGMRGTPIYEGDTITITF